jgi:hypothetical protein
MQKFPWPAQQQDSKEYQKCCQFLLSHVAQRDDSKWPQARKILEKCGLPATLIDDLHERGDIYASESNIIFAHRMGGTGDIAGATLCPIGLHLSWRTIGEIRKAWFGVGNLEEASRVAVVENPIEALSYYALFSSKSAVVSLGPAISHEFINALKDDQRLVLALFGKDRINIAAAKALKLGTWPHCHHPRFATWNEDLRRLGKKQGQRY